MDWKAVNWKRGVFRTWAVLSVIWLAWVGVIAITTEPFGRYPTRYTDYLPTCRMTLDLPRQSACYPPLVRYGLTRERLAEMDAAYATCLQRETQQRAAAEAQDAADHQACRASRGTQQAAAAARRAMRNDRLEWAGRATIYWALAILAPVLVWLIFFGLARVMIWVVRGFGPP